jgi:S1-C subfamily serine protease
VPNPFPLRRLWIVALLGVLCTLAALSVTLAAPEKNAPRQQAATRSGPFVALPGGPIIFDFPTPQLVGDLGPISGQKLSALERSALAVVKLTGCEQATAADCTYSEGSGILIHPRGLILTALHVVVKNCYNLHSPLLPSVGVALLDNLNDPAQLRYRARVVAWDVKLDLALLWIDPLADGSALNLPTLPVETVDNREFRNSALRVMGFPQRERRLK